MICYTDGSANPNPGPGGFGVVVLDNDENLITCHSEQYDYTTNNKMELSAILWAFLKYAEPKGDGENALIIYSDSAYCVNTLTNWMFRWEEKDWKKSNNQTPENLDLIIPFFKFIQRGYSITIKKVKGHANNKWNEKADKLARNETADNLAKNISKFK